MIRWTGTSNYLIPEGLLNTKLKNWKGCIESWTHFFVGSHRRSCDSILFASFYVIILTWEQMLPRCKWPRNCIGPYHRVGISQLGVDHVVAYPIIRPCSLPPARGIQFLCHRGCVQVLPSRRAWRDACHSWIDFEKPRLLIDVILFSRVIRPWPGRLIRTRYFDKKLHRIWIVSGKHYRMDAHYLSRYSVAGISWSLHSLIGVLPKVP